ncbi:MAG: (2Fe-2S)-binding protein [Woeseiaceae bacterium]
MSRRISENVSRPQPVDISVNGETVIAYEGESVAAALIAVGTIIMSRDSSGRYRGPFCNMGVCFECMVEVEEADAPPGAAGRVRACLTPVRAGLRIRVPVPIRDKPGQNS